MLIRIGYDIELGLTGPTALIFLLQVHPDRARDLVAPEHPVVDPPLWTDQYTDSFGNRCARVRVPAGVQRVRLHNEALIHDTGWTDPVDYGAWQHPVDELPVETLPFLLGSRYCEVDSELLPFAWQTFGQTPLGWARVQAVCDFVHQHLRFDYQRAFAGR
ncbi:MAG: transglutaminase, partial [Variovorax paradoxus]